MMQVDDNQRTRKHPRPAGLKAHFTNKKLVEMVMRNMPNANKSKWRTLPKASLDVVKNQHERLFRKIENSIVFAFCTNKLKFSSPDIIPVRNRVFWDVVRSGDCLLLSDRHTHHYTSVDSVDMENDLMYLSDPWPNDIFLLPGRNDFGIKARVEHDNVIITKEEFLKVVIGLLTVDNQSFVDYYFTLCQEDRKNPKILYSFGQTLLKHGYEEYVFLSIPCFQNALEFTDADSNNLACVQALAFSYEMAMYICLTEGRNQEASGYHKCFTDICDRFGQDKIIACYSETDFYRLGLLTANQNNLDAAANYFTRSVNVNKDYYESHLYLALALQRMGYFQDSVNSATEAIDIIKKKYDELQQKMTEKNLGVFEKSGMSDEQSVLRENLARAYKIRELSFQASGDSGKHKEDQDKINGMQE